MSEPHITYQLQMRRCGKLNCSKCRDKYGPGHGPYWYAYWYEGTGDKRRLRCRYVGKNEPAEALKSSEDTHRKVLSRVEQKTSIK